MPWFWICFLVLILSATCSTKCYPHSTPAPLPILQYSLKGVCNYCTFKNSALLIIQHPLPNDWKQSLIIRQRSPHVAYMLYMGIECVCRWNVEYHPLKIWRSSSSIIIIFMPNFRSTVCDNNYDCERNPVFTCCHQLFHALSCIQYFTCWQENDQPIE